MSTVAVGLPNASAAGAQPEPMTTATSCLLIPVCSAMAAAALFAQLIGRHADRSLAAGWDTADPPLGVAADLAQDVVLSRRNDLIALSHDIHAEPELAFAEHRSCAKTRALVAERGFTITDAPAGLDTAFRADYGSGDLAVAVCAEYDALPGIGHACGHNIIAASAVGAALALAEVADDLGLKVVLMGTPAEESGGGKALLLKAGAFDDICRGGDGAPGADRHR